MPYTNQRGIYDLISALRKRAKISFEDVRERMSEYLGFEYNRNTFYNKLRRKNRNPVYLLDEMLALISAFTTGLPLDERCTADEAFQLFDFANMRREHFVQLNEFFDNDSYEAARSRFVNEHPLGRVVGSNEISANLPPRDLEIEYLNQILEEYKIWQSLYTAVAGIDYVLASRKRDRMIKTLDTLPIILEDFDQFVDEAFSVSPTQSNTEDVLQTIGGNVQQIVILGDAGSGKTTVLRCIAANLAEKAKTSESQPLPVLVELGKLENNQSIEAKIKQQLNTLATWYPQLYESGRLVLLLDGINEIPMNVRESILEEVRSLVKTATTKQHFLAITCRVSDSIHDLEVSVSRRLLIKPLDPIRIRQFIVTYLQTADEKREHIFWALAGDEAKHFWYRFIGDVGNYPEIFWLANQLPPDCKWGFGTQETQYYYWNQWLEIRKRPNTLLELACNPYMLLMIMQVFVHQNQVPNNRSLLFHAFIDYILIRREGLSAANAQELIRGLSSLAFAMKLSPEPAATTTQIAIQHLGDASSMRLAQGANILQGEDSIRFAHQLLQEYFAALKLDSLVKTGASVYDYWSTDSWWMPNTWDDVAVLASGFHASDMSSVILWLQDAAPEIAARCIAESGGKVPDSLRYELAQRWRLRLDELPIQARASIGRALGIIGIDPRDGVGLTLGNIPAIDWVEIPAGSFIYGTAEQRYLDIFAISRYPITHIQFQAFIDAADGFYNGQWWEGLGCQEKTPGVLSFPYTNHPRERVSWYDAMAFCRWLSSRLGYEVTLPTEYQWEKAARGTAGLIYPYGNEFDVLQSNVNLTGIGKTSTVGLFPKGASPYGVCDMSGNVFEWCLNLEAGPDDLDLKRQERRSLRGGSWAHSPEYARTDHRYANRPELRRNRVGFRIVRVHSG